VQKRIKTTQLKKNSFVPAKQNEKQTSLQGKVMKLLEKPPGSFRRNNADNFSN